MSRRGADPRLAAHGEGQKAATAKAQFELRGGQVLRDGQRVDLAGFEFLRVLGKGANGAVFEAEDRSLGRRVAVKFWAQPLDDTQSRAQSEISKLANLVHPLLATVHRFDSIEQWPYAVMELVDGVTLRDHLATQGAALTLRDRCALWSQFSTAIRYIHGQGTWHGDPHVGNVVVFEDKHNAYQGFAGFKPSTARGLKVLDTGTSRVWKHKMAKFSLRESKLLLETAGHVFRVPVPADAGPRPLPPVIEPGKFLDISLADDPRVVLVACDAFAEFIDSRVDLPARHHEHGFDIMDELRDVLVSTPFFRPQDVLAALDGLMHPVDSNKMLRRAAWGLGVSKSSLPESREPLTPSELQQFETARRARRNEVVQLLLTQPAPT